jgi:hypothetical protein
VRLKTAASHEFPPCRRVVTGPMLIVFVSALLLYIQSMSALTTCTAPGVPRKRFPPMSALGMLPVSDCSRIWNGVSAIVP